MSDIFISYSTPDRDRAREVAVRLTQEGWSVFWDRKIPPGRNWDEFIEEKLNAARVMIVLWSRNSVVSEWVRIEATIGANRKILVPAFLEKIEVPLRFKLIEAADISDWKSGEPDTEGMPMLIEAVAYIGNLKTRQEMEAMRMPEEEAAHKVSGANTKENTELKYRLKEEKRIARLKAELKRKQEKERKAKEEAELKRKQKAERLAKERAELKRKRKEERKSKEQTELIPKQQEDFKKKQPEANAKSWLTGQKAQTVKDIDGNVYHTVTIGTQVWMAENLKTTKYNDGTAIPLVIDNKAWAALNTPAYCWYENDETANKNKYGALYNWHTVNTNKLCPKGWHVPTYEELTILTTYLGGDYVAGGKLKEMGKTHWLYPNEGATNKTGFTALPSGYRNIDAAYSLVGLNGFWWSSSECSTLDAHYRFLLYSDCGFHKWCFDKQVGLSVRCLRDF